MSRDGDALDRDARDRGTSVYFPRRVIPMLPEQLSNELCSLKPAVDRLCMACEMTISADGEHRELQVLSGGNAFARPPHLQPGVGLAVATAKARTGEAAALLPHLENLYALYKVLAAARARRGAIDFETIELELKFDAQRQDRDDRSGHAQRCAQADRGMHAGRQRLHRRVPAASRSIRRSTACTRARRRRSSPR